MIQTSADYAPFAQVRQVDCLISFEVLAKTLNKKAIAVTASPARVGSGPLTINGIPELAAKYGTLERYGWPLDGSCDLLPSSGAETGFWSSAVSDDAGDFSSPVTFRYELPSDTATFGWTFHFDAPAMITASLVRAVCYDAGGAVIDTAEGYVEGTVDPPRPTVTVGIEPVQAGSGDPSPDNVRPISGWTGANIHVSPTSDPADGRTYSVEFPTEAGTVYGGTLDVTSGVLTVSWEMRMASSINWGTVTNAGHRFYYTVNSYIKSAPYRNMLMCSAYKPVVSAYLNPPPDKTITNAYMRGNNINVRDDSIATLEDWRAYVAANDFQILWGIAPVTYPLTPVEISRILDTDNVWADCGPVLDIRSVPGNRPQIVKSGSAWSFNHFVQNYRAVEFTFYGTNLPRRMLRLAEIDFGVSKHFNRDSIKNARIKYGMAPDSSAFPAKEIVFTFDNSDGEFNVLSPIGVYQYWRNGQVLTARIKVGDEIVPMGLFYVTKAEIGENRLLAKVTAHDPCYQLANQKFYPMELAAAETVRLDQAVPRALIGSDLAVDYGGLGAEPVSVAVRDTHDKRVILRYLAQAVRAALWIDRDNVLRFRRISTAEEDGSITADELYGWSGVSISEEYTGVTLTVNRELQKDADGNDVTETYRSGVLDSEGTHTATYENPCVAAASGQAVADWLLVTANRRKKYAVKNRCDPAVEIGDTLVIADAFHNDDRAVVTGLDIEFDGGLSCVTEADREF